ncbi:beta-ketoacyl-[acyl-carrier-protein] synthase family protein [Micromonospora sp. DPT]|uniref:beta-ketoacyl-[acyl-carrier-protein] synthase family protein n=1 Tax=Micromonospora sp. DPT TaxID=3142975 RepID=UPI003209FC73
MGRRRNTRFDVAVTGMGLVTPAGIGVEANWARVCSGRSTASRDEALAGLPVDFSCRVPDFDPGALLGRRLAWRLDRVSQLALVAAREAVADAGLDPKTWDGARVGVVVGSSFGGAATYEREHARVLEEGPEWVSPLLMVMAPVNMSAGYLAIDLGAVGPNLVVSTACAAGSTAIGTARQLLEADMCDVVIAGGTESTSTRTTMASLHRMGALSVRRDDPQAASRPFDADRDGFVAGEGAGMLILERAADAQARGARVYAHVSGYGATADGHHPSAPHPEGAGAQRAVRAALADALVEPADVGHVNAHGTSTPLNDVTESRVIRQVLGDGPAVTSTKGVIGHLIGAAGAVEAAYTVLAVHRGQIPPTANLTSRDPEVTVDVVGKETRAVRLSAAVSNSFGFGGQNSVLVVTAA